MLVMNILDYTVNDLFLPIETLSSIDYHKSLHLKEKARLKHNPPKSDLYHTPFNLPQLIFIIVAPGLISCHLCTSKMGQLATR